MTNGPTGAAPEGNHGAAPAAAAGDSIVLEPTPWKEAQHLYGPATWSRCEAWIRRRAKQGFYVLHCGIVRNTERAQRSFMKRRGLSRIVPGPLPHEYEVKDGKMFRHS